MYQRTLRQMQVRVRLQQYVMTLHAEEEMHNDNLSIFDIEHVILTGEIIERQTDHHSGEWKYLVAGQAFDRRLTIVVSKLTVTNTLVIITVYVAE